MDFKVSRKETRLQPEGPVEVLVDNVCDLYPIFASNSMYDGQELYIEQEKITGAAREDVIMDAEILDDDKTEMLDRAMFALMKQRGQDPVEPEDGVQWAEAVIGEVNPLLIIQQADAAVQEEGPAVRAIAQTVRTGNKDNIVFKIEMTGFV